LLIAIYTDINIFMEVARMYVEEIKKKSNGKKYSTYLIRESFKKDGKVKHRKIANITKLPIELISFIKKFLRDKSGNFTYEEIEDGATYEYGASAALLALAQDIGLDKTIYSKKTKWRENALAMIIGRIIYQGSKLSLVNTYKDTFLWKLCGHELSERPNVNTDCYLTMDMLLERKSKIEKKLAKQHLSDGQMILYDMTNTWLEGKYDNSEIASYGKSKGGKKGYKIIALGLITDKRGCPVSVEIFKGSTSDQTTVFSEVEKLSEKYNLHEVIFTGDRGMLTPKKIAEVNQKGYKTITAVTHSHIKKLVSKGNIKVEMFKSKTIKEVKDLEDNKVRYILCKSENTMRDERATRKGMIKTVTEKLSEKAKVKRKRDKSKTSASIGRIFEKYKIEKLYNWEVDDDGKLSWSLKKDVVESEAKLDGCYIIRTETSAEKLSKEDAVLGYRSLQKVEQAFKNMKTVALELRPIYHKTDDRLRAHIFLVMLAYYLQWHALQRLQSLFDSDEKNDKKRWDFHTVITRLQSIRKIEKIINGVVVKHTTSRPDEEQLEILKLLQINIK